MAAAPAILVLGAAAWFLSHRIALILTPGDPQWTPAHQRWTALVGLAIGLFLLAGRDRIRTGRNATGTHPAQPVNSTAQPTTTKPTVEVQHHGSQ